MQLKTRIIVDSTADLVPEIKERVYTVPSPFTSVKRNISTA